ncbi:MAG TPA: thiamine biosynthesis protein ThiS [Desulfobacteraceae bacterium]|nr:thiamine biosynthesis protein ThiS [Desulfobacteraceae bacterium]|tara:strand:- start:154 stop:444 length:291 start_codon:yes stop_codon:yes gene_type:complete
MPTITFNAFSFLQKTLKEKNIPHKEAQMEIAENATPHTLMDKMGLDKTAVEAVFINGKVAPFDTVINDGDRVAFVPHGTPGPYRVFLGFKNPEKNR